MTLWVGFICLIFACLALDLGVFHRRNPTGADNLTLRQATKWSLVWISLGVSFSGVVYYLYENHVTGIDMHGQGGRVIEHGGRDAAVQYLTAFVLEKSLSIDNLFVISLVFKNFGVKQGHQHRVLYWGILGAIVTRGLMIVLGFELVQRFEWLFYIFGVYLVYQGGKILVQRGGGDDEDEAGESAESATVDRERGMFEKLLRKVMPVSDSFDEDRFTTHRSGRWEITPMLICLFVVEMTDVVFALDSIPAVLAISTESFIAFTSNIFAILGLRALYFVLAELVERFSHLETSIAVILVFIGVKLFFHHYLHGMDSRISLGFIFACIAAGIAWSWRKGGQEIERKSQLPKSQGGTADG